MSTLADVVLRLGLGVTRCWSWRAFERKTRNPAGVQQEVLAGILRRNQHTRFGQEHDFASIRSPEDYAARVPIRDYEGLRPYIERQQGGAPRQLTSEDPVRFSQTSGTTGLPKYIPILQSTLAQARSDQRLFACCQYAAVPALFRGKTLAFVAPAVEGHLPSGMPYGSMSGLLYDSAPGLLRRKYVVPSAVFACPDYELKYLLIAAFAVAERSVSHLAAANPSTFLRLAEVIRTQADLLVHAVESGKLPGLETLAPAAGAIARRFPAKPRRAAELRRLFRAGVEPLFTALWPDLAGVSCWREGSCRALLPALQRLLHERIPLLELGYLASEARGSLPVDPLRHREVPSFHANYFEFIEPADWEAGRRHVRLLSELDSGRAYYVILTTPAGLYRYFINDLVTVDGWHQRTPTIKFLEKGSGVTSLTGEKLHENQVTAAVEAALNQSGATARFFLLVADEEQQGYDLYVEAAGLLSASFLDDVERELSARNVEYQAKRASGRLRPIRLKRLRPGASEAHKAHLLAQGQREAQFKAVRLQTRARVTFDFDRHLEWVSP